MIKVHYNISNSIERKINKNINKIIELFIDSCEGLDYDTFLQEIFPGFYLRTNRDKCINVIYELKGFTTDEYEHILSDLSSIYEYALYYLIVWWLEVTDEDYMEEFINKDEIKTQDDEYFAKYINDINEYKSFLFEDWDFLDIPYYLKVYKKNPAIIEDFLHINLEDYLELMPDDIKATYLRSKRKQEKQLQNEESVIIKSIYNAIKMRENDPYRLMDTSETQLSDDINHIVSEKLRESGLLIARETPSGFAKKGIGEIDFYIYSSCNDIHKVVAIGENKEWGNFEKQIKQLLGYMNKDTQFGFTIIFNKKIKYNTLIKKRKEILENFYVEIDNQRYFETESAIWGIEGIPDVVVTSHKNPEDGNYFKIYHFIVNANLNERRETAKQARS